MAWRSSPPALCPPPFGVSRADCCDGVGVCDLPPEPFAGPILPFYRFLERENRIARRAQAEADVARIYSRRVEAQPGSRIDVMA